ncbi:winged helix-turn-helix domain-containing protein [Oscillatoria laete-virens NRMC-F 0139]|nr:winged helix-turn-helix domain-containing protein [Oscillatoria laete-virens]MDL5053342.1 winged helix-turn-helix domain-containing protein [Oscillatoria laete-virens NRMC-F 0139]
MSKKAKKASIKKANAKTKSVKAQRKIANKPMSGLDAAAKVLIDSKTALNAKEILQQIQEQNLWKTSGKTPHATLYAAIIREIARKKHEARFRRAEKGKFISA